MFAPEAAPVEAAPVQEVTVVSEEVAGTEPEVKETNEVSTLVEAAPVEEFIIVSDEEVPAFVEWRSFYRNKDQEGTRSDSNTWVHFLCLCRT